MILVKLTKQSKENAKETENRSNRFGTFRRTKSKLANLTFFIVCEIATTFSNLNIKVAKLSGKKS